MPKAKGNGPLSVPRPLPLVPTEPTSGSGTVKQQCCVVCYTNFYPFTLESEKYSENMTKNFYVSLNIKSLMGSDEGSEGDDEEEVLSLPFCGTCHTKVALMASYHIELQNLKSKFNNLRNDLAFTVVESIGKNSREGPIDSIRQQIHDSWKLTYEKERESKAPKEITSALDQLVSDPKTAPHNCGDFVCCNTGRSSERTKLANGLMFPGDTPVPYKSKDLTDDGKYNPGKFSDMPTLTPFKNPMSSPIKMPNRLNFTTLNNPSSSAMASTAKQSTNVQFRNKTPLFKKQVQATVPSHIVSRVRRTGSFRNGSLSGSMGRWKSFGEKRKIVNETFSIPNENEGEGFKNISPKRRRFGNRDVSPDISDLTSPGIRTSPGGSSSPAPTTTADGQVVYSCKFCTKYYDKVSRLRRHESFVHPNSKKLQCDICKQGFSSTVAHKRHMQHQHNLNNTGSGETMHCPYCIKVFVKSSAFEAHLKTHELIRTNVKGRRSSRSSGLFGIMADTDKGEEEKVENSVQNTETETHAENEIPESNPSQENVENVSQPEELLSSNKPKKRPNPNRPFGGGRRRRGKGKKKVKPVDPNAPPPQKRNRQPKPALPSEPVRKSTRQRGVVLDDGMPMYPSAEEEIAPGEPKENKVIAPETVDMISEQNPVGKENSGTQQQQPTLTDKEGMNRKQDEVDSSFKIVENALQKSTAEVNTDSQEQEGSKEMIDEPPASTSTPNSSKLDEKPQNIPSGSSAVNESLEEPKNSTYTLSSGNDEIQNDNSVALLQEVEKEN